MLDREFWFKLKTKVIPRYRDHIFGTKSGGKGAKDVFGKPYKRYSSKYSTRKKTGRIKRQDSKFKGSNAPVLTGDLMRDFQLRDVSDTGFSFGTVAHGGKVKHLDKMDRSISTNKKPLPTDILEMILTEADEYVEAKLNKQIKGRTFNI